MGAFEKLSAVHHPVVRVLVVDDSTTMLAMLHGIIANQPGYELVGLAKNAAEAVALVDATFPDIVLIDLCMPYISGSQLLSMLAGYPKIHKVVLSGSVNMSSAIRNRLVELGAVAFFDKAEVARNPAAFRNDLRTIAIKGKARLQLDRAGDAVRSDANVIYAASRFPVPRDEQARIRAIAAMKGANLAADPCLDIIARHVAAVTAYPIVAVSLIDAENVWPKAAVGFERQAFPREESFCTHVLCQDGPLVVADATADSRFSALAMVTGELCIRSYVGVPIIAANGVKLGVICAADSRPRCASKAEIKSLADAAKLVAAFLEDPLRARRQAA